MTQDISDLVTYYQGLLNAQYSDKPKFLGAIKVITQLLWVDGILDEIFNDLWNIESDNTFVLKTIGNVVGVSKFTNEPFITFDPNKSISFSDGTANNIILLDQDTNTPIYILQDSDVTLTSEIPNDLYRQLLKLKIIQNFSNGTIPAMNQAFEQTFGVNNIHILNLLNMNIMYFVKDAYVIMFQVANQLNLIPSIAGVGTYALKNKKYVVDVEDNGLHPFGALGTGEPEDNGLFQGLSSGVYLEETDFII